MSALLDLDLWRQAEALFEASLDRPASERAAFLDHACQGNSMLRSAVDALLVRDGGDTDFLEVPLVRPQGLASVPADSDPWVGRQLGPYRLLRRIGAGGMSLVFLGERVDGEVEQQVAVKVIRGEAQRAGLLRSLRRERQILTLLDHPNIARALDGGTTEEGMPYIVLEHVDGMPITEYCDHARLSIRRRVALFRGVCDAVDYAHRRLVIHRDLKPSNILVTAAGVPKLLDFGIAKMLDATHAAADPEAPTRTRERYFTPQYASPEQRAGAPVSTASDVFSLGIVLYELLTGLRPVELEAAPYQDPAAPSRATVVAGRTTDSTGATSGAGTKGYDQARRAEARGTTPALLRRVLRGDLDHMTLRCLRPVPEDRYRSAAALDEDLRRYLAGLPVTVGPPTWSYRLVKFVQRHRLGVALGVGAAIALVTLGLGMVAKSREAVRERDRAAVALGAAELAEAEAEAVTRFLTDAFSFANPYQRGAPGAPSADPTTVQDVLTYSAQRVRANLDDQPRLQARLMLTLGSVLGELGQTTEAATLLEDALALRRSQDANPVGVAEVLNELTVIYGNTRRLEEAESLVTEALALARGAGARGEIQLAESLTNAAMVSWHAGGDLAAAVTQLREGLALRERHLGIDHREVVQGRLYLARMLVERGELDASEALLRKALKGCERTEGPQHVQVASILGDLATLLTQRGDFGAAEALFVRIQRILEGQLGEAHPNALQARMDYGLFLRDRGDFDAAESVFRATIEQSRGVDEGVFDAAVPRNNLGLLLLDRDRPGDAEPYFREALAITERNAQHDRNRAVYLRNLGLALHGQGDAAAAEPLFRVAADLTLERLGPDSPGHAFALTSLASARVDLGAFADALALTRRAEAILLAVYPSDHPRVALTRSLQGGALTGLGRFAEAERLLVESFEVLRAKAPGQSNVLRGARDRLEALYQAWDRPVDAARLASGHGSG